MAYDLNEVTEAVKAYLAPRHPELRLEEVSVVEDPHHVGQDWMFNILVRIHTMNNEMLLFEFCRYMCDSPFNSSDCASNLPKSMGRGNDRIEVKSGRPLLIGDGDDSLAVKVDNGLVTIWLRDLD